jgi:hypothetical protein
VSSPDDLQPIVDLREDGYYVGAWFLAGPQRDWLGVLRHDDGGTLRLDFRYRYYGDPTSRDPFDGTDDKSVYTASYADKTEEEAIKITDALVAELVRNGWCGTRLPWKVQKLRHRMIVRGDGRAFMRAMASAPFAHFKIAEPQRQKKEGN